MDLLNDIQSDASTAYNAFLSAHSDAVSIGDFIVLYGKSELEERNATLEVQVYLPGWFAIGDDSGGTAILMRLDGTSMVYRCGHGAIGSLDPALVADSFSAWLADECPARWMEDEDE